MRRERRVIVNVLVIVAANQVIGLGSEDILALAPLRSRKGPDPLGVAVEGRGRHHAGALICHPRAFLRLAREGSRIPGFLARQPHAGMTLRPHGKTGTQPAHWAETHPARSD